MAVFTPDLLELAADVLKRCRERALHLSTAESCTGGLVAGVLTEIAGSSDVVDCGYVTYSNTAKQRLLGVPEEVLIRFGAVSRPVAQAMAAGALASADLSVAVTGIAGPGGGSPDKPVGLVHFATALKRGPVLTHEARFGDLGRAQVRQAAVMTALKLLQARLD
jgi:nicotinamide-nucleotide amidase